MNSTDTETAIYVNLGISIFNGIIALMTHMGWMKFQSTCCKQGTCCQITEEMGTENTKPSVEPVPIIEKKE